MSITITTDLFCDSCGNWDEKLSVSGMNYIDIRKVLKRSKIQGWERKIINGKAFDVCPKCIKKEMNNE